MNIKSYSELVLLPTFEDRFEYLRLDGIVGETTFGFDRYMNQVFYRSLEWKKIRDTVIARDLGCDLGIEGHEIFGRVIIHHLNPIRQRDLLERTDILLDPEYLITTTHETHQAIHYGDKNLLPFRRRRTSRPTTVRTRRRAGTATIHSKWRSPA